MLQKIVKLLSQTLFTANQCLARKFTRNRTSTAAGAGTAALGAGAAAAGGCAGSTAGWGAGAGAVAAAGSGACAGALAAAGSGAVTGAGAGAITAAGSAAGAGAIAAAGSGAGAGAIATASEQDPLISQATEYNTNLSAKAHCKHSALAQHARLLATCSAACLRERARPSVGAQV